MVRACEASLRRMGRESMEMGQLHWSTANYAPWQERPMWDGLGDCRERGLIADIGVSNYGPRQIVKVQRRLAERGLAVATAQVQFSLLSNTPLQRELKAVCDDLGIALIAYSPLGLGMLSGKYGAGDAVPEGRLRRFLFPQILGGIGPLLRELEAVAAARRKTMAQVAVNWCIAKDTIPIVGARTLAQAEENLGALGWLLSDAEVDALDRAAAACTAAMTQNAFQVRSPRRAGTPPLPPPVSRVPALTAVTRNAYTRASDRSDLLSPSEPRRSI